MKKLIKFDLINNAKDSLNHAVEHLTNPCDIKDGDLKRAIRDTAHVIELLLKERLRRVHPAFMWQDIDKYPSGEANTVSTVKAVERLFKIAGISLPADCKKTIYDCKKIRDSIEHYEFQIELKEAKGIIGRMLSFIFDFSKSHLELDLEAEFRKDDRWKELVEIYEFWEAHSKLLAKQLSDQGKPTLSCPSCGAQTFDSSEGRCILCEHQEERVKCNRCDNWVWEFEAEIRRRIDGDEDSGVYGYEIILCRNCIEEEAEEQAAADMAADRLKDEYRDRG